MDGVTDYFNIIAGVLLGDTLATYLFIISLDFVLRTSVTLRHISDQSSNHSTS